MHNMRVVRFTGSHVAAGVVGSHPRRPDSGRSLCCTATSPRMYNVGELLSIPRHTSRPPSPVYGVSAGGINGEQGQGQRKRNKGNDSSSEKYHIRNVYVFD